VLESPGLGAHQPGVLESPGLGAHQPVGLELQGGGEAPSFGRPASRLSRMGPRSAVWAGAAASAVAVVTLVVVVTRHDSSRTLSPQAAPTTVAAPTLAVPTSAPSVATPTPTAAPTTITPVSTLPAATVPTATVPVATVSATTVSATTGSGALPATSIVRTGATSASGTAAQDGTYELQFTTAVLAPQVVAGQAFPVEVTESETGPVWSQDPATGAWTTVCGFGSGPPPPKPTVPINLFLVPVRQVSNPNDLYSLPAQATESGAAVGVGSQYPGLIRAVGTGVDQKPPGTHSGCTYTDNFDVTGQLTVPADTPAGEYFVVLEGFPKQDWKGCDSTCRGSYGSINGVPPTIVVEPA